MTPSPTPGRPVRRLLSRLGGGRDDERADDRATTTRWTFLVPSAYAAGGIARTVFTTANSLVARGHEVRTLEAYPVDKPTRSDNGAMWWGSRTLYERAGFREVERRSATRVVMRRTLRPRTST